MKEPLTTAFVAAVMRDLGYQVREGVACPITGGAADSRLVSPGQLFTAFPGEHEDGNAFVAAALVNGAAAVICSHPPEGEWPGRTVIIAPDPTRAAGQLANAWRRQCNPRVVGITGTVGKTTAKEITAALLAKHFRTHHSPGNFNSREGLPLALLSLRPTDEVSVLEIAMDSKGEIAYLCDIAEPEVGIVLNIGLTHVSKLGSIEAIAEEKLTLGRYTATRTAAVVNCDDPRIAAEFGTAGEHVLTFGESAAAALRVTNAHDRGLAGTAFDLTFAGETVAATCPIPGLHVISGALAAVGAALSLGLSLKEAAASLAAIETHGRADIIHAKSGATIIDDRYNSSPSSLAGALRMLGGLPPRRIAFLGRMAELGEFEAGEHRKAGELAASQCDLLVTVGPAGALLAEAARQAGHPDVHAFDSKYDAAAYLAPLLHEGDTVLVKASRGEAFETVLPILEGDA